jgi:ferritin-like protein
MASDSYHEPLDLIPESTRNLHRAIVSLIEELQAIDWYQQRAGACSDAELKAVLLHHRNEEIEHAIMNLEWIRRNDATFDENLRIYLFSKGPITEVEAGATGGENERGTIEGRTGASLPDSLGIGSLKQGGGQ